MSDPREHLPLKPVDFLVLLTLVDGERHGYGIVQDIDERTGGEVRLLPGNLYAMLRRLASAGLVAEAAVSSRCERPQIQTRPDSVDSRGEQEQPPPRGRIGNRQ